MQSPLPLENASYGFPDLRSVSHVPTAGCRLHRGDRVGPLPALVTRAAGEPVIDPSLVHPLQRRIADAVQSVQRIAAMQQEVVIEVVGAVEAERHTVCAGPREDGEADRPVLVPVRPRN